MRMNFWNDLFKTESQSKLSALCWDDLAPMKDSNGFKTNLFGLKLISKSDVRLKA